MRALIVLILGVNLCSAYNILALFPHTGKSHYNAFEPLMNSLIERGHNLTLVTHFGLKNPPSGYNLIDLSGSYRVYVNLMTFDRQKDSYLGQYYHLKDVFKYLQLGVNICDAFLNWPSVQPLFTTKERFDVIITEMFNSDCSLGFVDKFKAPHVAITSHIMMPWGSDRVGALDNPSYIPTYFSLHGEKMSFLERVENTFFLLYHKLIYSTVSTPLEEKIMKKHFRSMPDLETIARNTSVVLLNSHHSLSGVVPRMPNVIEVGGMHVKRPQTLPQVSARHQEFISSYRI